LENVTDKKEHEEDEKKNTKKEQGSTRRGSILWSTFLSRSYKRALAPRGTARGKWIFINIT
jgi:hypothetical protein